MDASQVLESFDTLWFFHDVLGPRINQIDQPNTVPIKEKQRLLEVLTDRAPLGQRDFPETGPQSNSGEIGFEIGDEIKSGIVQPPKFGEIEFGIGAKNEPETLQKTESGEIEIETTAEIEPDRGQQNHPVLAMEFKTTAAMLENSTEKRRVRRKSRRKNTRELDLLRRPALITPYSSGYPYGYCSGGNQWHRTIEIPSLVPKIASTTVK